MPFPTQSVIEQLGPVSPDTSGQHDLPFVFDERVLPGDTIPTIFRRIGVSDQEALDF